MKVQKSCRIKNSKEISKEKLQGKTAKRRMEAGTTTSQDTSVPASQAGLENSKSKKGS